MFNLIISKNFNIKMCMNVNTSSQVSTFQKMHFILKIYLLRKIRNVDPPFKRFYIFR